MNEPYHNPNSSDKTDVVNCPICLDDKHLSHFFKFKCSHFLCKQCYKKLKDKERCFYCRTEIIDRKAYETFSILLVRYLLWIVIDLFMVAFIFMTFTIDNRSLVIVFYIEVFYSSLLPLLLIRYDLDFPPPMYSNILCCLKINWLVFLMLSKNTWWKYIILSVPKIILMYTVAVFEKSRINMEVTYLNSVAEVTDISEGTEV